MFQPVDALLAVEFAIRAFRSPVGRAQAVLEFHLHTACVEPIERAAELVLDHPLPVPPLKRASEPFDWNVLSFPYLPLLGRKIEVKKAHINTTRKPLCICPTAKLQDPLDAVDGLGTA